jgi:hypothetical protein
VLKTAADEMLEAAAHKSSPGSGDGGPPATGWAVSIPRSSQVTGRFRIRWDASRTTIHRMDVPTIDPETARL